MPKNGENWGKLIVAKGFKKLPKVQKIARSGHTDGYVAVCLVLTVDAYDSVQWYLLIVFESAMPSLSSRLLSVATWLTGTDGASSLVSWAV